MAGTGRVSERLAGAGWDFTCVDLSREMLQVLWRKAPGWEGSARAICADVCDLPLPTRFALVVIPFHSFAELTDGADQRRALAEIHRVLLPGGRCICTLHNPRVRTRSLTGIRELRGTFDLPSGGAVLELYVEASLDAVTRIAESVQTYRILDSGGEMASERVQKVRFALIERPEFEGMARAAGFRVDQLYGDYARAEFLPDESPHMIWILEKPAGGGVWR
jgi:SAM-dependent methyltransferase